MNKPGVVVHTSNPGTREVEAGGSELQGHLLLGKASLGYLNPQKEKQSIPQFYLWSRIVLTSLPSGLHLQLAFSPHLSSSIYYNLTFTPVTKNVLLMFSLWERTIEFIIISLIILGFTDSNFFLF